MAGSLALAARDLPPPKQMAVLEHWLIWFKDAVEALVDEVHPQVMEFAWIGSADEPAHHRAFFDTWGLLAQADDPEAIPKLCAQLAVGIAGHYDLEQLVLPKAEGARLSRLERRAQPRRLYWRELPKLEQLSDFDTGDVYWRLWCRLAIVPVERKPA